MAANPFDQFDAPASAPAPTGNPFDQFDAPAAPQPKVRMDRQTFNAELLRRARETDQSPAEIKAWAESVYQPEQENTAELTYGLGPNFEKEITTLRAQPNVPTNIVDAGVRNTGLATMFRGAADELLFNRGDELAANLRTGFGLAGDYEAALLDERTARAQDDPTDRFFGQLGMAAASIPLGGVLSKAPGRLGQLGEVLNAVPDWVARGGTIPKRMGRAIAAGGGAGALYSSGALTGDETLPEAALQVGRGTAQGAMLAGPTSLATDTASAVARKTTDLFSGRSGATSAVADIGQDFQRAYPEDFAAYQAVNGVAPSFPDLLRFRFENLERQLGRQPNLAEVIGPQGGRLTDTLSAAPENAARFQQALPQAGAEVQQTVAARMTPGARDSQAIIDNANRRADIEFAPYKDAPVQLSPTEQIYIQSGLEELPNALGALKGADKERIIEGIQSGQLTGGDLDLLRRALRKQSRSDMGASFSTMAEQVEDVITNNIPGSMRAVKNYARRMSRAEGSDIGRKGVAEGSLAYQQQLRRPELSAPSNLTPQEQAILDTLPAKDRGKRARLGGARLGFRAELVERVQEGGGAAYTMAAKIGDGTTNFAQNLRATMRPQEAEAFITYMQGQKQAIDSLAGLSNLRPEQVATAIDSLEEATRAGFFTTSGGVAKAGFLTRLGRETLSIGKDAARKLADDLLDPAKFEPAMKLLEKRGITRDRLNRIARDSIIAAFSGNNEMPEGTISVSQPQE